MPNNGSTNAPPASAYWRTHSPCCQSCGIPVEQQGRCRTCAELWRIAFAIAMWPNPYDHDIRRLLGDLATEKHYDAFRHGRDLAFISIVAEAIEIAAEKWLASLGPPAAS